MYLELASQEGAPAPEDAAASGRAAATAGRSAAPGRRHRPGGDGGSAAPASGSAAASWRRAASASRRSCSRRPSSHKHGALRPPNCAYGVWRICERWLPTCVHDVRTGRRADLPRLAASASRSRSHGHDGRKRRAMSGRGSAITRYPVMQNSHSVSNGCQLVTMRHDGSNLGRPTCDVTRSSARQGADTGNSRYTAKSLRIKGFPLADGFPPQP